MAIFAPSVGHHGRPSGNLPAPPLVFPIHFGPIDHGNTIFWPVLDSQKSISSLRRWDPHAGGKFGNSRLHLGGGIERPVLQMLLQLRAHATKLDGAGSIRHGLCGVELEGVGDSVDFDQSGVDGRFWVRMLLWR